jgi:Flp pilus assembly protein TadD
LSKNKAGFARIMAKTGIIKLPMQFGILILSTSWLMGCALSDTLTHADLPKEAISNEVSTTPKKVSTSPKFMLSADQVYRVLAAESLASKGQVGAAANIYLDLVERYGDASMAQRAYELASQSGSKALLELASQLNTTHNPNFIESWQVQVVLQLRAKDVSAALSSWESFYQHSQDKGVSDKEIFLSTATLAQEEIDIETLLSFSKQLVVTHPSAYSEFTHIMFIAATGDLSAAFEQLEQANQRYPEQAELAQLTASLAIKLADGRGVNWLRAYWQAHPQDILVGEQLGRIYVAIAQLTEAQTQFLAVLQAHPNTASIQISLALVDLELKQPEEAEQLLTPLIRDKRYADMARYYLAQALYFQDKVADAMLLWSQVLKGEYRLDAVIWRAQVLSKQGKLDEATMLLESFKAVDEGEQNRLLRARVRLSLLKKQPKEALILLNNAIFIQPNEGELWQERANIKLELNDGEGFEQDMHQALILSPDDADMLNALGYYFVEQKKKLVEARQLIEKANNLLPNKHYINDSLGWLFYQEGNLVQAESLLSKAYYLKNDAEILHHWLVVLLAQGNKAQAQALVSREAKQFSDDEALTKFLRQMSLVP